MMEIYYGKKDEIFLDCIITAKCSLYFRFLVFSSIRLIYNFSSPST